MKKPTLILEEEYPYTLPGHIRARDGVIPEIDSWEKVPSTLNSVRRVKEPSPALKMACPPNLAEQVKLTRLFRVDASDDVCDVTSNARAALAKLAGMARNGNGRALWQFAQIVSEACEGLGQMTATDPATMRPIARKQTRWPMMMSTHPLNCDPVEWLEQIELGKATNLTLDRFSKWKPDAAARIAYDLYSHLEFLRGEGLVVDGTPFEKILPDFSRETSSVWWGWAWHFLTKTYPHPEQVTELDALVMGPSKRKSAGRRKQAIHDIIKARFLAISIP